MFSDNVFIPRVNALRMKITFPSALYDGKFTTTADALVDTGATNNFMTKKQAEQLQLVCRTLERPRIVRNIDGTTNLGGQIQEYVDLEVKTGRYSQDWFVMPGTKQRFYLADLGEDQIILGYPWVASLTSSLNWTDPTANPIIFAMSRETIDFVFGLEEQDEVIMRLCKTTHAQEFAIAAQDKTVRPWTELVPKELHDFEHVFSEEAAHRFPEPKRWDHAIDLLPDPPNTLDCKVYPLSQPEQIAQNVFLEENLEKGYL
jgi:hypothetical protein